MRTKGGHEHWTRADLTRPITIQTHVDSIPEFIVKNNLRNLNMSSEDFWRIMEGRESEKEEEKQEGEEE